LTRRDQIRQIRSETRIEARSLPASMHGTLVRRVVRYHDRRSAKILCQFSLQEGTAAMVQFQCAVCGKSLSCGQHAPGDLPGIVQPALEIRRAPTDITVESKVRPQRAAKKPHAVDNCD